MTHSCASGLARTREIFPCQSSGYLTILRLLARHLNTFRLTTPEGMAKKRVADELWELIRPLLPGVPPERNGCRPRIDDLAALTGILFVIRGGSRYGLRSLTSGCELPALEELRL